MRQDTAGSRTRTLLAALATLAWPLASTRADEPSPIRVIAQVPSRPYFVGQTLELRIGAEAGTERPEIVPPVIPQTDVSRIGSDLSPVTASGIGAQTSERNLYVTRFRLIPHRAGWLRIPPVRAVLGSLSAASPPLSVEVHPLPETGRTQDFLGGVGEFTLECEATPTALRVGQDFLYTIRVTGPAARGMSLAPDLARFRQIPLGLQIHPLPAVTGESPPSRWFCYRIRPTRAGEAALPPVAIMAFDPKTTRYVTRVTPSLPIRVAEVPRFDPAALDYAAPSATTRPRLAPWLPKTTATVILPAGAGALVLASLVVAGVRMAGRRKVNPGKLLMSRARKLDPDRDAVRSAQIIAGTLAEYFEHSLDRPRGVLTPEETAEALARITRDEGLAARGARLIAACDRARYSELVADGTELVAMACRLFEEIGRRKEGVRSGERQ
jgi:hypothetical protein